MLSFPLGRGMGGGYFPGLAPVSDLKDEGMCGPTEMALGGV